MSDSYQAIYDAVRSRIHGCDVNSAVESAVSSAFSNASHSISCLYQDFSMVAAEQQRPAAIFRPSISMDGNKWCALYGEHLQDGVAGFGDSPAEAMQDFDKAWYQKLPALSAASVDGDKGEGK